MPWGLVGDARRELNPQPPLYEKGAVSVELRARPWWLGYFLRDFFVVLGSDDLETESTVLIAALNRSNGV